MKVARFPYLFVGGLLLLLTFVPVSTAVADKPLTFTEQFEVTDVVNCGDFDAIAEFVERDRVIVFFDNEGNPVRFQIHANFRGIVTNSVTGKSVPDRADFTIFEDFVEGTTALVGKKFGITVPGEGIAVHDTGNIVFDADFNVIFVGGPHQVNLEGLTALCAAVD